MKFLAFFLSFLMALSVCATALPIPRSAFPQEQEVEVPGHFCHAEKLQKNDKCEFETSCSNPTYVSTVIAERILVNRDVRLHILAPFPPFGLSPPFNFIAA